MKNMRHDPTKCVNNGATCSLDHFENQPRIINGCNFAHKSCTLIRRRFLTHQETDIYK